MNEQTAKKKGQLTPLMLFMVVMVSSPPMIVDFFKWPPAAWLNAHQSEIFGGYYYPKITFVLLMTAYWVGLFIILFPLALLVKKLTGKTVVQLLKGDKGAGPKTQ